MAEHSLEIQIPFLQKVLKNFKIVPVIFDSKNKDWERLARTILENVRKRKILVIASSDLSYYPSRKGEKKADAEAIKEILTINPKRFQEKIDGLEKKSIPNAQTFACA